jgi:hypothetical protein
MLLLLNSNLYSQTRQRTATSTYAGIGYSLVFFTNSDVTGTYPIFNFSSGEFLTEINPFFGIRPSKNISIELSPSFIFTTANKSDGFYYTDEIGRRYYDPQEANLFALPLNANIKFYPFADQPLNPISNIYAGGGGGIMYIKEDYLNYIYSDSSQFAYLGARNTDNSMWVPNYNLLIGYGSTSQFGYNFELAYRFVPLDADRKFPLVSSIASNLNSVNLSLRIMFNF